MNPNECTRKVHKVSNLGEVWIFSAPNPCQTSKQISCINHRAVCFAPAMFFLAPGSIVKYDVTSTLGRHVQKEYIYSNLVRNNWNECSYGLYFPIDRKISGFHYLSLIENVFRSGRIVLDALPIQVVFMGHFISLGLGLGLL